MLLSCSHHSHSRSSAADEIEIHQFEDHDAMARGLVKHQKKVQVVKGSAAALLTRDTHPLRAASLQDPEGPGPKRKAKHEAVGYRYADEELSPVPTGPGRQPFQM